MSVHLRILFSRFREMRTLYPHVIRRVLGVIKNAFGFKPAYPCEPEYAYDEVTEQTLARLKKRIPAKWRGDNPEFSKQCKNIFEKEERAKIVASQITEVMPLPSTHADPQLLKSIREHGFVQLHKKQLSYQAVSDISAYLSDKKAYPAHIAHFSLSKAKNLSDIKKAGHPFASYDIQTVMRAPHIANILTDETTVGLISDYFGCLPTLASINAFWAFQHDKQGPRGSQHLHRDVDDYRACTYFINLTDTTEDDGAHCYIDKSNTISNLSEIFLDQRNDDLKKDLNPFPHRIRAEDFFNLPLMGYGFDKLYTHFFKEKFVNLFGPRGTMVVTDNYGIHRGIPPRTKDRLVLWMVYALTAPVSQAAEVKHQRRVHFKELEGKIQDNALNRYILRNVVNFGGKLT